MTRTTPHSRPLLAWLAAATLGLVLPVAQAADAPAYAISGDGTYIGDGANTTGFIFTAQQDAMLTALGFHDYRLDGLNVAHDVGLYSADGALLATATVAAGTAASLIGEYRYAMLASAFELQAGTQYVLAAHTDSTDGYRYASIPPASLTVDPRIGIAPRAGVYVYGPSLTFPTQTIGYDIYATPNMLLAAAVPEPGTWALALVGLALVARQVRSGRQPR